MSQLIRLDTHALNKALLGFDTLFGDLERRYANQVNNNYPPYNIIKTGENSYVLEIAVTGFSKDEITVEVNQDQLVVRGQKQRDSEVELVFLHHGLASRDFTKIWPLAEFIEVGEAVIKNGVLTVKLERVVPEALKPRFLNIKEA